MLNGNTFIVRARAAWGWQFGLLAAIAIAFVLFVGGTPGPTSAAVTFVVDATWDSGDALWGNGICDDGTGDCTLRAAIEEANALAGADTINFSIGGGGSTQTISPGTNLPVITDPVTIDGATQGGGAYAPIVLSGLSCTGCTHGLAVTGGSSTIKSLTINGFNGTLAAGVAFVGPGGGNTLRGSLIGTDTGGGSGATGNGAGVVIWGSSNNTVGVVGPPEGFNHIGNNTGPGVWILANSGTGTGATGNIVQRSSIGIKAGNGGPNPNSVGVDIDGVTGGALPVTGNIIGGGSLGPAANRGVHIGGNTGAGIYIHGAMASGNFVRNAWVGFFFLNPTTKLPFPNGSHGVHISDGAHDNLVGGFPDLFEVPAIYYNTGAGIFVEGSGVGNRIGPALTGQNGGLGIDVAPVGPSPLYDAALSAALYCASCAPGGLIAISGYLRGAPPNTEFKIEVYQNFTCDPSGYGEADEPLIGSGVVYYYPPNGIITNGSGDKSASGGISGLGDLVGTNLVSTLSQPDGTSSEYSTCREILRDTDGDGIEDSVDLQPAVFSDDTSDVPLGGGGTTFAKIIDRAGCYVSIVDLPNPDGGVIGNICLAGGGPAKVSMCNLGTFEIPDGVSVSGKCGSLTMQVDIGPLEVEFGLFTATLPTNTLSTIEQLTAETYSISNDASSAASITADCTTIPPNNTVVLVFSDTDGDGLRDNVETNGGSNVGPCDRGTDPNDPDTDGDGCGDGVELGSDEKLGGLRDPNSPWDWYDVDQNGSIDLFIDILGVITHYSLDTSPPYDAIYDRGASAGPYTWSMTAPDGSIDLFIDILGVIGQYSLEGCT